MTSPSLKTWCDEMLVRLLFLLPLTVFAQESTVESLRLRTDASADELSAEVVRLVDPSNSRQVRLHLQSYQQEVTIKSTLHNVAGDSADDTWQTKVINAASTAGGRSVDDLDGVTWSWATSVPVRNLDSGCTAHCSVQVRFVMTWSPDIDEVLQWRHKSAALALRLPDFETEFKTEIRDREAADDADAILESPVITTVSFAFFLLPARAPTRSVVACTSVYGWLTEAC